MTDAALPLPKDITPADVILTIATAPFETVGKFNVDVGR